MVVDTILFGDCRETLKEFDAKQELVSRHLLIMGYVIMVEKSHR